MYYHQVSVKFGIPESKLNEEKTKERKKKMNIQFKSNCCRAKQKQPNSCNISAIYYIIQKWNFTMFCCQNEFNCAGYDESISEINK